MYLEISDRQTGKTQRLINQIYRDKQNYDIQVLMGINQRSLEMIKREIKQNAKVKICLSYDKLRQLIANNPNKKIRLYVDEFMYSTAFCNNFNELKNEYFSELIYNRIFFIFF
jgi:F0F1-type ATP synthase alpha subunit